MTSLGAPTREALQVVRRALTLVELLVVLSLLGLVTMLVAPSLFRAAPTEGITAAEAELRALLAQSRSIAIREGSPVVLTIDPSARRFWRTVEGARQGNVNVGSGGKPEKGRNDAGHRVGGMLQQEGEELRVPPGVELDQSVPRMRFTFLPNGSVLGGSLTLRMGASTTVVTVHEPMGVRRADGK